MKFTYTTGQRPLDGFNIKRGIGKGGFGEVYFAVSDAGKEVALKLLCNNSDIELRGVAQCLNLKHPNLIVLYDLRTDARGEHWVMMEYIAGETLGGVLSRYEKGLPRELTKEWFLSLARAVAYLHDHGIVHRDLKPGNLFIENGMLKVGDVGLSKSMSGSQRSAQTQSIGTVHYMAPEISTGNYTKTIDIYALGIILYEMLTGRVPFEGESAGEVLMKHLTTPPDLSKVPAEFVPIVSRALAKNPTQRYQTVADMARDVEAAGAVVLKSASPMPERPVRQEIVPNNESPVNLRGQLAEVCGSMSLAVFFAGLGTILWAALARSSEVTDLGAVFFLAIFASWGILVAGKLWPARHKDAWGRRVIMSLMGALVGLGAVWVDGWGVGVPPLRSTEDQNGGAVWAGMAPSNLQAEVSYLSYFALAFFALRWWRLTDARRSQRFSFAPLLAAGFWGLVLLLIVKPQPALGAVVLVMAAAIVQLVSPWEPPPPQPSRKLPCATRKTKAVTSPERQRRDATRGDSAMRIIASVFAGLCLMTMASTANAGRPKKPAPPRENPSWSVVGYGETEADAQQHALSEASKSVAEFLKRNYPGLAWTPPDGFLKQRRIVRQEDKPFSEDLELAGHVVAVRMRVELTPDVLEEALVMSRHERMGKRQHDLAIFMCMVVAALIVLCGYLRLEEATRGYYTHILRFGALGLLALTCVSVWLLR